MKIALLTSSRADYGIYYPLIKNLSTDKFFKLEIIAFGTHNSIFFGNTVKQIEQDGFNVKYKINSLIQGDSPEIITDTMGLTFLKFSQIWSNEKYDLCITLGDRYEMFAAAYSTIPFNIPIVHISGGEQTLGAIDNSFRDALTVISTYHFASTEKYANRIIEIKGANYGVYNVGSLSIDNLKNTQLYTIQEFRDKFKINMELPSILITIHPETVSFEKNEIYIIELIKALNEINDFQFIITMPNADTMGGVIRNYLNDFINKNNHAIGIESFGMKGYLSCLKHCSFLLGNTSSGFVEASFSPKYVINLGDRQKGRIVTKNIINCDFKKDNILEAVRLFKKYTPEANTSVYGTGESASKITQILKSLHFDR